MSVLKNWNSNSGLGCRNDFGSQFAGLGSTYSAHVATTTDTTLTVPSGSGIGKANDNTPKFLAVFSYAPNAQVWVANNVATAPSLTSSFVASAPVINPRCKEVQGGDVLHFYATAAADVSVEFFAI